MCACKSALPSISLQRPLPLVYFIPWTVNMLEHDPRLAGLVAAVAAGGAVIFWLCRSDPREPPVISSGIPFVGHLINLLWEGAGYFSRLDTRYHLGLYTLPILGRKVYIVNSPQWAMAMHRCGGLHLNPIFLSALPQLGGLDKEAMSILQQNALNELGDGSGPLLETEAAIKAAFRHDADDLNGKFLQCYTPFINKLQSCMSDQTIPLWQWLRHAFSIASATVFYGPQAPFALEASLADDFWYFADRLTHVALVPSAVRGVAFRQTVQSHERVIEAMVKYFESEGERQASTIVQRRAQIDYRSGMTKKMHGRNEMSFLFAILINTVPVTFWLLSYAFSDQDLLRQLRAEVDNCVTSEPGKKTRILHVDRLKDYCSLLNSVMRETERFSATLNINRIVTEDTQIRNHGTGQSYLLKKGNLVTVAANAIHFQSEVVSSPCRPQSAAIE